MEINHILDVDTLPSDTVLVPLLQSNNKELMELDLELGLDYQNHTPNEINDVPSSTLVNINDNLNMPNIDQDLPSSSNVVPDALIDGPEIDDSNSNQSYTFSSNLGTDQSLVMDCLPSTSSEFSSPDAIAIDGSSNIQSSTLSSIGPLGTAVEPYHIYVLSSNMYPDHIFVEESTDLSSPSTSSSFCPTYAMQSPENATNSDLHRESIDFVTLEKRINYLKNYHKLLTETPDIIICDDLTYKQEYTAIFNDLLNADKISQSLYETYMNKCLLECQYSVSDPDFIKIKMYFNKLLELLLKLHEVSVHKEKVDGCLSLIRKLLRRSFIVLKQSTQCLMKEKSFDAVVVLLCHPTIQKNNVNSLSVSLYSANDLKNKIKNQDVVNGRDDYQTIKIKKQKEKNNEKILSLADDSEVGLKGDFKEMKLINLQRPGKVATIFEDKYALVFEMKIELPNIQSFTVFTYSKPIIIITNIKQQPEALESILWDTACSSINREPFEVYTEIKWSTFKIVLKRMFKEMVKDNEMVGRELTENNLMFIFYKIMKNSGTPLRPNILFDDYVINRNEHLNLACKRLTAQPSNSSSKKTSVIDWVIRAMLVLKNCLAKEWTDGRIHGFIDKEEAKILLLQQPVGTFIVRFSESQLNDLSIDFVEELNNRIIISSALVSKARLDLEKFEGLLIKITELKQFLCINGTLVSKEEVYPSKMTSCSKQGNGYRPVVSCIGKP